MSGPVELMDKDTAAATIEPLVALVFQQLAQEMGKTWLQSQVPIDVTVAITLQAGDKTIATAEMTSQVSDFETVN
jgi:hypothetical protein